MAAAERDEGAPRAARARGRRAGGAALLAALAVLLAGEPAPARDCTGVSVGLVPLLDLGPRRYRGLYPGGLYPGGRNAPPTAHAAAGAVRAAAARPLAPDGTPDPDGRLVVLLLGMSNALLEFRELIERVEGDPERRRDVVLALGARGGQTADLWAHAAQENFDRVRDRVLAPRGLTEAQVQVVLVKNALPASARPPTLPAQGAQARTLEAALASGARALRVRYPNARQVFYTSRIYGGYASTMLSPEPYAYESGFAVKWLIEAQITQQAGGGIDPVAGDLALGAAAPWLAWGPYLWADGGAPRSDGLTWACEDLSADDGTHPAEGAIRKAASRWHRFLRTSPYAAPWYRRAGRPIGEP